MNICRAGVNMLRRSTDTALLTISLRYSKSNGERRFSGRRRNGERRFSDRRRNGARRSSEKRRRGVRRSNEKRRNGVRRSNEKRRNGVLAQTGWPFTNGCSLMGSST
jgi:hypothetical protein